jgi:hypothetical protein
MACIQLLVLIFGSGLLVKMVFPKNGNTHSVMSASVCYALGMSLLAFVGYFLSMMGFFTPVFVKYYFYFLWIICIAFIYVYMWKCHSKLFNLKDKHISLDTILDLILFLLILPTMVIALITPITDGDGLYSFNTWAMHWGLRDDMRDYWFLAYGQFLSIVSSWGYKLSPPWQGGIPSMHYAVHASYVLCAFLGLLIVKRIPMVFSLNWKGSLIGLFCALLLLVQEDVFHDLKSGKAEPVILLFEALIVFKILSMHESASRSKIFPYLMGALISSLMFIKPSVVPLGFLFLLASYIVEIKINLPDGVFITGSVITKMKIMYPIMARSLISPLISGVIILSLVGPFYVSQYRFVGDVGYSSPQNMSFGGGDILSSVKIFADESDNVFISNGKTTSSIQLLVYRISEVFMSAPERGKKIWESVGVKHFFFGLVIVVGFIFSLQFVWLWTLHLAAFMHTWLWYIYASYGYYDLIPAILLYIVLAGIGYAKVFELLDKKSLHLLKISSKEVI